MSISGPSSLYALYNAEKKELFGLFRQSRDLAKYAFANYLSLREPTQTVVKCADFKRRVPANQTNFNFDIAIRRALDKKLDDGVDFWIKEGYPAPNIPHKKMAAE